MAYQLELIDSIDRASITALAGEDITTTSDLLLRCSTEEDFRALAAVVEVDESVLADWVAISDLTRLVGLSPTAAKLLLAAGVNGTSQLRQREPVNLQMALARVNDDLELRTVPPDVGAVARWIEQARQQAAARPRFATGSQQEMRVSKWRGQLLASAPQGSRGPSGGAESAGSDGDATAEWDELAVTREREHK